MGKITLLARTSLLIIFLLGSSLSFLTAKNTKAAEITISETVQNVSCSGGNDGSISVSVSGGVAPYTITWTELSQTTENISDLPAGSYTITVTDSEGQSLSDTFEVTEPAPLQLSSSTTTEVSCHGASDGSVTAGTVSGGTAPYEYSINGNFSSSNSFSGLTEGTYTLTVRDANGCEASEQVQVSQPQVLSMSGSSSTAVSCNGGSDGSVTAGTVSGGTGSYQYKLNNGSFGSANSFSNLSAGTYTITVKDANNCETSNEVTVTEPEALTMASSSFSAASCNGGSDGSVTAGTVSGGTGSYQYKLNNGSFGSANSFSNLSAGTYTITVKDANNCETSNEVTVTEPEALTMASSSFSAASCNGGSDGSVTAGTVSGGTGSYQYKLNNGSFGSANSFSNLSAGTYTITVKDANNCETSNEVTVTEPDALTMSSSSFSSVTCNGGNDGSVTAGTVSGGTGSYQYKLDNGSFGSINSFSNLSAGTYTITVKDANNCETSNEVTVTEPDALTMASSSFSAVSCNGGSDGTITAGSVTGGNGGYKYSIDGNSFISSNSFSNLSAGTYTVHVKDDKGCTTSETIEITEPDALGATISFTDITCSTANDGTISITNPVGGYGTYEYSINNGASWQGSGIYTGLSNGTYPILIRDKDNPNCTVSLDTHLEISRPFKLMGDVSGENVSCKGGNDGRITISNASGGYDLYEFSIDGSNWQSSEVFENLSVGTYQVQIRDAVNPGCVEILDPAFVITEPEVLTVAIASKTDVLCNGYATGAVTASATGGTAPYTYSWGSLGPGATKTDLPAGTYSVTVKDANGCTTAPLSVTITQPETFVEITSVHTTSGCYQQNNGTARVEVSGGTGNYSFLWSNGQTSQTATGLAPGNHTVTVKDGNGCEKTRTVTVSTPTQLRITGFLTTETTSWGSPTGTATVQVSGGAPNYTFKWTGVGSSSQTGQTAHNLPAGTYTVTVTDANGCNATKEVTIIDALDANIIPTSICEDDENLIRTSYFKVDNLTARGGTGPYTYQWNFGKASTPSTATGPGIHRVEYSEIGDKTISVIVTDSKGLKFTQTIIQYVGGCFADDCGSNDLSADDYFIGDSTGREITTQNCDDVQQKYLYVKVPSSPHRYSLYIEYIYSLENIETGVKENFKDFGCFYDRTDIPDIAQTIPIDYSCGKILKIEGIYFTFSNNKKWKCGEGPDPKCYSTNNEATVRSPLYAVAFPNELLCNGGLNGTINARASGGSGTYTYKLISSTGSTIRNSQTSSSFTGLPAGKYKVIVNDGVENFTTAEVEIRQPSNPLSLALTSETGITCYMGSDGTATVQATGGTPNSSGEPYIYVWSNGQTTATATNLSAGEYTVRVIDANGCEVTLPVQIAQPAQILAVAGPDKTLECGTTSTRLEAVFTSEVPEGETPQTGEWTIVNGPAGGSFADKNDPHTTFSGAQGTYTLRWTVPCGASDDVKISMSYCSTLDFDGINDHIVFGDNFNTTENFALEAWVKQNPNTSTGIKTILSKRNISGLTEGGFDLIVENNIPKFRWNNSSLVSQYPIGTDRWYHIAVIKGGTDEGLYVDGIKVNSSGSSPGAPSALAHPFVIGAAYNSPTPSNPANYFHGWIEEVRLWNVALDLEQLHFMMNQRLMNNGGNVKGVEIPYNVPGNLPWTSLAGYYQMEKVENGYTIGEVAGSPNGKLINITTLQERTAPLPYESMRAGSWFTDATWLRPQVWDPPGSKGIDGKTVIDWNIARISHNINSGGKNIKLLGLLSKTGKLTIANPGEALNERNSGQSLTITHYLQLNGSIDLVGESQLVQTDILNKEDIEPGDTALPQSVISVLEESSSGFIERDQQGTANSYNYNYWSSPVSLRGAPNNSTYTIATAMLDGTNSSAPKSLTFGGTYWFADGSFTTPRKVSNYWLHKFRGTANVYSEWKHMGSTGVLNAGEGYTMKGTSGTAAIEDRQNYVFSGKPNNGTIPLTVGQEQNYLLGNPFPSAIDVNKFILDNLNRNDVNGATNTANIFNGAVYFWDHFSGGNTHILKEYIGGYATRNLIDGVPAISNDERVNANEDQGSKIPGRYIPVGQGFFINTSYYPENAQDVSVTGGDVIFRNSQRDFVRETTGNEGGSLFLKPEVHSKSTEKTDNRAKIRLDFSSPLNYNRQILVGADPNTTEGFDLGYDAALNDNVPEDMFWLINYGEYVIQGVPDFNLNRVLQLGIKTTEEGNVSIKLNKVENLGEEVNIFVKDLENKSFWNLKNGDFTIKLDPGYYHERFQIVFKEDVDSESPEEKEEPQKPGEGTGEEKPVEVVDGEISIKYISSSRELVIQNPKQLEIMKVTLHNLGGQILEEHKNLSNPKEAVLPVRSYSSAVYLVKLKTTLGIIQKKIIISN